MPSNPSPLSKTDTRFGPAARSCKRARGFVPYSPLGKGFLTGAMNENIKLSGNDFRSILPCFAPEAMKANQTLVDLLKQIGERKKATPAQIALAWLLARKPGSSPYRERPSSAVKKGKQLAACRFLCTSGDLSSRRYPGRFLLRSVHPEVPADPMVHRGAGLVSPHS